MVADRDQAVVQTAAMKAGARRASIYHEIGWHHVPDPWVNSHQRGDGRSRQDDTRRELCRFRPARSAGP
jgi:hypothetical protein